MADKRLRLRKGGEAVVKSPVNYVIPVRSSVSRVPAVAWPAGQTNISPNVLRQRVVLQTRLYGVRFSGGLPKEAVPAARKVLR